MTNLSFKNYHFVAAMGLGSFLIFFIQPLVSKAVLPFLGGSSSIWATSLAFFTLFLFLGYLYAYLLTHFKLPTQLKIHGTLLFLSILSVVINFYYSSPLYLPVDWFADANHPAYSIVIFLISSVGLPYIFLASTAPLLQNWYVVKEKEEPYKLYSISNLGSLLGLLLFPLFLERYYNLYANSTIWAILFLVYIYLFAMILEEMSKFSRRHPHTPEERGNFTKKAFESIFFVFDSLRNFKITKLHTFFTSDFFWWVSISLLPSALLVATTTFITQVIAPIPLLWIVPLTLYLLSFIVAFSGLRLSPSVVLLSLFFVWQVLSGTFFNLSGAINYIYIILICFFLVSCALHQYLYTLRPQKEKSAIFYVALSLGGAVGTILVSILAPIYFKDFIEIYIILAVTAIVLTYIFVKNLLSENIYVFERLAMFGLVVVVSVVFMQDFVNNYRTESVNKIRNFYGVTELTDYEDKRQLNHGTTLHGEQYFDEKLRLIPTLYYSYESGVGRTVMLQQYLKPKRGLVVGVVGLGTGTMAAYCRPKDEFDFFEIDERIRSIAENSFSYLENCKNYKIIFGDGRLSLKNTPDGKYDVLAIDAFSDDSIPMHMVTKEAIQIFMDKTKDTGVLAVHTSNRYIDLEKVVKRIAFDLNIPAVTIGGGDENIGSVWILLARDEKLLINNIVKGKLEGVDRGTPLWTDDFTNIFPVMYQKLF